MSQAQGGPAAQVDAEFVQSANAAVAYWRVQTQAVRDAAVAGLNVERQNLYRVVRFGLKLPALQREAALLALQLFVLVERQGYWDEWIPILERALAYCGDGDERLRCLLANRLGQLYRRARRLEQAIATHEMALRAARAARERQLLAEAHFHLGESYRERRAHEQARRHATAALELFRELDSEEKWQAGTLNTLGILAWWQGELDQAQGQLQEAIEKWREWDEPTELARALNNLSGVLRQQKQYEAAWRCLEEARQLLAETASELDKVLVQVALGGLWFEQGRYEEAAQAFCEADLAYLRRAGHTYYEAYVAQGLGNVLLKQGCLPEAEESLRRSVGLWRQTEDELMLANSLGTLAKRGVMTEALTYYDEALQILERHMGDSWAQRLRHEFSEQRSEVREAR